jgi:hypothetical protein
MTGNMQNGAPRGRRELDRDRDSGDDRRRTKLERRVDESRT